LPESVTSGFTGPERCPSMPFVLAAIAALGAAYVWYLRMQGAKQAAETLFEAANDVRLAARRFGFRRRLNLHPVDSIDDARIAAVTMVAALMQIDKLWDQSMSDKLVVQVQSVLGEDKTEAEELVTLARWMAGQCATNDDAVRRAGKRLMALAGAKALPDLNTMIERLLGTSGHSEALADSLETLRRVTAR
jgi:hypothetical protein